MSGNSVVKQALLEQPDGDDEDDYRTMSGDSVIKEPKWKQPVGGEEDGSEPCLVTV